MLFEGTEKKFEIMVTVDGPDLRGLGDDAWRAVIAASRAEPLHHRRGGQLDAWLLSESSLFVSARQAVMITCGRTTLIDGLVHLLDRLPADDVASLIYERKNENYPDEQPTRFVDDRARLQDRLGGESLAFGDLGGDHVSLYHLGRPVPVEPADSTLEVLMHGIDPAVAALFAPGGPPTADLRQRLGLDTLLAGFAIDDHLFTPQGYSLNAIRGRRYATMHVTPEREHSYASFELAWNLDVALVREAVRRLLRGLRPERVDLLLFMHDPPVDVMFQGYTSDRGRHERLGCGYPVLYRHLVRT